MSGKTDYFGVPNFRFVLLENPAPISNLYRFHRCGVEHFGHPGGDRYPLVGNPNPAAGTGDYPDRGTIPGRCPINLIGYPGRIHWEIVR